MCIGHTLSNEKVNMNDELECYRGKKLWLSVSICSEGLRRTTETVRMASLQNENLDLTKRRVNQEQCLVYIS
jgi:hypothetical protein